MKTNFPHFEKTGVEIFSFLEKDFGFKVIKRERDSIAASLTYQNETTAIEISIEPLDGGVFVLLSRLVDGKIPKYPIFVTREMTLHSFYLDDLVQLRVPGTKAKSDGEESLSANNLEKALMQAADQLKKVGRDILGGDFRVFSELETIVKARLPKEKR